MTGFQALILAGSRPSEVDPAAAYAGVAHKALIVLDGRTLLARVAEALRAAGAGRIAVACSDPAVVAETERLGLDVLPAAAGPAESVAAGIATLAAPLLVTTADHALLEAAWVSQFMADAPPDADVAILLAPEALVRAAAPETQRTYLAFRDGRFSGCNLFLLATPRASLAIDLWRTVQAHRKQPWKIAWLLGPRTLFAYALGRLTLDQAVRRLGRQAGVRARAVKSAFGLAAVDVDKPADLDLVRAITSKG
ncbi:nucleotidyltransferase family protein [Phenylobacterium immobile]|uniref:nucleotidyltransferase family protein n=1 Tax=Phenylobacterium immobile TaxID=21 RepID=UPI000A8BD4C6|nr:nucleotidyltransferase family protein [Phenylobacterium immobile]